MLTVRSAARSCLSRGFATTARARGGAAGSVTWEGNVAHSTFDPGLPLPPYEARFTETVMRDIGSDVMTQIGASSPLERLGQPDETAAVAAFLASADSSYMTGSEVFVDGGLAQV